MPTDPTRPDYPSITDPARPRWHFHPPAGWMNDPNGIFQHDGWWHLFYQHNPGGDTWADMHWGHARSRDLLHWEHLPIALRPQTAHGELHCYSGCCVPDAAGGPHILYTSVPPPPGLATQVLAVPQDAACTTWTQHVTNPVLDLATHDGPAFDGDWRDPYVFHAAGRTFLILGARLGDDSVVALYENPDGNLRSWTYRGVLLRAPVSRVTFYECPSIVPCGDRWILFVSPCAEMEWHVGRFDPDTGRFAPERSGLFDAGHNYYATQAKLAPDGRILAFGWVRGFASGRGWNGCLGAIREVRLDDTGTVCSTPLAELTALQSHATPLPAATLGPEPLRLPLAQPDSSRGVVSFNPQPGAVLWLELAGAVVRIDDAGVHFDDRPVLPLAHNGHLRCEWLLDRSVLEWFVNERACCTQIVTHPTPPTLALRAEGDVRLETGCTWTMSPTPATALSAS
ncbi:MAG: glycoside hydrolase family 32 protein [Opitutaceae bacterium]|nr:glycoside hydrolase family 32 protein [Opitutaceae bacterium]